MPPNFGYGSYSAGAGILDGINGIFDRRREDAELERQRKRQETADASTAMNQRIGLALQRAQLNSVGIREGAVPNAPTYQLPLAAVGGVDTSVTDTSRYQGLGDGFYQDRNATPEFKAEQLAVKTKAQQQGAAMDRERLIGMALQDQNPASALQSLLRAGISAAEAKTMLETARGPEAKAPTPGTEAYYAMKDREAQIGAKYRGGGGAPVGGQEVKTTEGERKAAMLYTVAEQASAEMARIGAPTGPARLFMNTPIASQQGRQYRQAASSFARSYLYLVSGATANEGEVKGLTDQIVDESNDSAETRALKAERRRVMLTSMQSVAGRAMPTVAPPLTGGDVGRSTAVSAVRPAAAKPGTRPPLGQFMQRPR